MEGRGKRKPPSIGHARAYTIPSVAFLVASIRELMGIEGDSLDLELGVERGRRLEIVSLRLRTPQPKET